MTNDRIINLVRSYGIAIALGGFLFWALLTWVGNLTAAVTANHCSVDQIRTGTFVMVHGKTYAVAEVEDFSYSGSYWIKLNAVEE